MTDFTTLAGSTEDSRPIEIYYFDLGGTAYRYTSAEDEITAGGETYTPLAIQRTSVAQGRESSNRSIQITLPGDNEFAALYKDIVPGRRASVTVWSLERDEIPTFNTQNLEFVGSVLSVSFPSDGYIAEINCRSIEDALNRSIPRFTYMSTCNHVLYDERCGVDPTSFQVTGTVSAVADNVITLPGANAQPDGYYTGGYCTPTSGAQDFRLILDHTGNDLTLLLPFAANVDGVSVQAFAGCDHLIDGDCATLFDNVIEFGGFAFVPNRNPFTDGLD